MSEPYLKVVKCPSVRGNTGRVDEYSIFFSNVEPSSGTFISSDLWLVTDQVEQAAEEKSAKKSKANMGDYVEAGHLFYYRENQWQEVAHNVSVSHPVKHEIELDTFRMSWRYKARYKNAQRNEGLRCGQDSVVPKPACRDNAWIAEVLKEWNALGVPQTHHNGETALKYLLAKKEPIPMRPPDTSQLFISKPGLRMAKPLTRSVIMKDVLDSKDLFITSVPEDSQEMSIPDSKVKFLACYHSAGRKSWSPDDYLFTMFNKHAESVKKCGVLVPPELSAKAPDMVYWKEPHKMTCDTVLCPPGAITAIHSDEHGIGISCLHAYGAKLWFAWPPTSENVKAYLKYLYSIGPTFSITDAIERLTGLEVFYIKSGEQPAWAMPPGVLHAVMTLSEPAAHTGFYHVRKEDLDIASTAIDTAIRVTSLLSDEAIVAAISEVKETINRLLNNDLPAWGNLTQKMKRSKLDTTSDYNSISRWVADETIRVTSLRDRVNELMRRHDQE